MATPTDVKALAPAPTSTPIIDSAGNMTFTWARWFQVLYQRIGGGSAEPLDQLNARVTALTTRVTSAEASIGVLNGEVSTINGEISVIQGDVSDLETRVGAIEAKLAAGFTGTITTAQLTPIGSQGSMTFTNGLLTAQTPAT